MTWFSTVSSSSPAVFTSVPDVLGQLEQLSSRTETQVFWNVTLHWASRMVLTYPLPGASSTDDELWPFKLPAISWPKTVSHPEHVNHQQRCCVNLKSHASWMFDHSCDRLHPMSLLITITANYKFVCRTKCPILVPQHIILSHKLLAPDWLLCHLSPPTATTET